MIPGPMLDPLQIQQLARKVLRRVLPNTELFVRDKISVGAPTVTTRTQTFRLNWRMVIDGSRTTLREKRADAVGQPEPGEDVLHRIGERPGDIALRVHQRHIRGNPVVPPGSQNA